MAKKKPVARRITPAERSAVYRRDGYACVFCDSTKRLTIDHVVPVSKGGGKEMSNLQTLCRGCNTEKGDRVGLGIGVWPDYGSPVRPVAGERKARALAIAGQAVRLMGVCPVGCGESLIRRGNGVECANDNCPASDLVKRVLARQAPIPRSQAAR